MITGLNHINLAVIDLNQSFQFYRNVLGFKPLCRWPEGAYFLVGDLWFCLYQDPKRKVEPNPCYTHIAFSVDQKDFAAIQQKISESGATLWKDNISEGDSLYFLDPNGHKLEIHVGDWHSRLQHKKQNPWADAEFFEH
jgi:catechol 2,3-dioxygenase-like lactoylglutathione lyase family enzyme